MYVLVVCVVVAVILAVPDPPEVVIVTAVGVTPSPNVVLVNSTPVITPDPFTLVTLPTTTVEITIASLTA